MIRRFPMFTRKVYVLATTAPECHVDAFSTVAYVANDAYDTSDVRTKGIITREAYRNGLSIDQNTKEVNDYVKWMAFLHYPRECATPDIQRYTDVTREYSVATGMRDGKGGIISSVSSTFSFGKRMCTPLKLAS